MSFFRLTGALVLVVGSTLSVSAESMASASTYLAGNPQGSCNSADPLMAGCDQSATVSGEYLGASSFATNTWIYGPGGFLTTSAFALNSESSAAASIQFSDFLSVAGATGSGNLLVTLMTSWSVTNGANYFPPPGGGVSVGDFSYSATSFFGPRFDYNYYVRTLSFPVSFNTLLPFSMGFYVSATGQQSFPSYPVESQTFAATIAFPTFQVADSAGNPIPGASVVFTPAIQPVPEPGGCAVMSLGIAGLGIGGRRWLKHQGSRACTASLSSPSLVSGYNPVRRVRLCCCLDFLYEASFTV